MTVAASKIARKAAEIMSERGFCKGTMQDNEGRVCFYGALGQAMRALDAVPFKGDPFTKTAITVVHDHTGLTFPSPVLYNDLPSTTAEDVISLLKEIGARLEELATE